MPQQALAMANSKLSLEMAESLAVRLWRMVPATCRADDHNCDRIAFAKITFETLLARKPTPAELDECLWFFQRLTALSGQPNAHHERSRFVHAMLNHNDFIVIR